MFTTYALLIIINQFKSSSFSPFNTVVPFLIAEAWPIQRHTSPAPSLSGLEPIVEFDGHFSCPVRAGRSSAPSVIVRIVMGKRKSVKM
jgi:hypothetical protein